MKTSCIQLRILERETRRFLVYGTFLGMAVLGLMSVFWHYEPQTTKQVHERRMVVDIIYLPPPERPPEVTPPPVPVTPRPQAKIQPQTPVHIPTVADSATTDSTFVTILAQPHETVPSFPLSADSIGAEPSAHTDSRTYLYDPLEEYAPDEPEEEKEVRDERREVRHDILGIRLDGPPDLIINGGRHALKSIKWMVDDMRQDRQIKHFREHIMEKVSEKDVRFLALLWVHGYLDPITLTVEERTFAAVNPGSEIMNNAQYLAGMESRGMVRSLMRNGRIVYESTVTKDEFIGACFAYAAKHPDDPAPELYLELITNDQPHNNTSQTTTK